MRTFTHLIALLPALVATCYLILHLPRLNKKRGDWMLLVILFCIAAHNISFLAEAQALTIEGAMLAEIFQAIFAPTIIIVSFQLLYSMAHSGSRADQWSWLYVVPVLLSGTLLISLLLYTEDNAQTAVAIIQVTHSYIQPAIFLILDIVVIAYSIYGFKRCNYHRDLSRFLFHEETITPYTLMSWLFLLLLTLLYISTAFHISHIWYAHTQALCNLLEGIIIHWIGYVGFMLNAKQYTRTELLHTQIGSDEQLNTVLSQLPIKEEQKEAISTDVVLADAVNKLNATSATTARRVKRLRALIEDKKHYLRPYYSIEDLAKELNLSRIQVSRIINSELKKSFRDYLGELRVDYAKRLLKEHPEYTLEQVAKASGFIDAPALSRKFKQLTGLTPGEYKDANL